MRLILILLTLLSISYAKNVFLVLGSHHDEILKDRVDTAIKYINQNFLVLENINWYLSGGKKFSNNQLTEAEKMSNLITENWEIFNHNNKIHYDYKSRNTAENIATFKKWLEINKNISNIYIVTSKFHHDRASQIFNGIFNNSINFKWILGEEEYLNCYFDEKIHEKNIKSDILKSKEIYISF